MAQYRSQYARSSEHADIYFLKLKLWKLAPVLLPLLLLWFLKILKPLFLALWRGSGPLRYFFCVAVWSFLGPLWRERER